MTQEGKETAVDANSPNLIGITLKSTELVAQDQGTRIIMPELNKSIDYPTDTNLPSQ
jgi:hypothetical protein